MGLANNLTRYEWENDVPFSSDQLKSTLHATTNYYNFVLLDQIDGRTWQVQWSTDSNKMMVLRIY